MSLDLIVVGMALAALSGVPGLFSRRDAAWGQWLAAGMMLAAAASGLTGVTLALGDGAAIHVTTLFRMMQAEVVLGLDALSAFFLAPVFLMGALGAVYGLAYWKQADHPGNARRQRLFWGLAIAGMALLVIARHALTFLLGWEIMALSAFFLVTTEDDNPQVRWSGWLYIVATHIGTLSLFAMFALMRKATGSYMLQALRVDEVGLGMLGAIFLLALLGFGLKAGLMPLHFWLPHAHANSPSHVSALLSGVVIKMGIYGLVRTCALIPQPPVAWGVLLLAGGCVSGVLGVLFAIGQHDVKRLLAYHSVENIGIIVMGLGLAMIGRSVGRPDWIVLGLAGCLLHVWNHGLFKALLFFSAGAVVHASHTREIDRLGGLARRMPWTAALFVIGAVAICGLPPLNGFVSEFLVYMGLLRTMGIGAGPAWPAAALAAPVLAMIGALAVACFVKVYGAIFLGNARSDDAAGAREAPPAMLAPMGVLAALCAVIGLAPLLVAPLLANSVAAWLPDSPPAAALPRLAPLGWISIMAAGLLAVTGIAMALVQRSRRALRPARAGTWDCGYAFPGARMQYTASSFAQSLVTLFQRVLRPRVQAPALHGAFPGPSRFESHVGDVTLDDRILPASRAIERWLGGFRRLQQGLTQSYLLYMLATVLAMLVWAMPLGQIVGGWFAR